MFGQDEEQANVDYMHEPNYMGEPSGAFAAPQGVPSAVTEAPRLLTAQAPAAAQPLPRPQAAVPFVAQPQMAQVVALPPGVAQGPMLSQQQQQQMREIEELNLDFKQRGHMLGVSTVATGLGMVAGIRLGGAYGAVAGSLFGGAAVNAYRAFVYGRNKSKEDRKEAVISGTWAVVSAALGGYILWTTRDERSPMTRNARTDREPGCLTKNAARSCGIRAII